VKGNRVPKKLLRTRDTLNEGTAIENNYRRELLRAGTVAAAVTLRRGKGMLEIVAATTGIEIATHNDDKNGKRSWQLA
jgi:hypothetical protein